MHVYKLRFLDGSASEAKFNGAVPGALDDALHVLPTGADNAATYLGATKNSQKAGPGTEGPLQYPP